MDLELTDEQKWLSESVETLLDRAWPPVEALAEVSAAQRARVWRELVEFGALTIGGDGLGAVELCLIARSLGRHLASVPYLGSAAVRLALAPLTPELLGEEDAIALALLEPGGTWLAQELATTLTATSENFLLSGEKVGIEHPDEATWLAISATLDGVPALALVRAGGPRVGIEPRPSFDPSILSGAASFDRAPAEVVSGRHALARLATVGSLLAAAEATGAATAVLELARRYACERRQFGRTIGSFQSLRHILADMYVRQASGWSTVLFAAAAFDDASDDAPQLASIAKAYVSRAMREVAHGAMQVFGGIAFTAEHPAHRFLRRIVVREQQFGDARAHERALGRALAERVARDQVGALVQAG